MSRLIPRTDFGPREGRHNYESAWHGSYLQAHLLTDLGKKRKNNEDSCILCVPQDKDMAERGFLFAVADGMGGALAGEKASHLALETLVTEYFNAKDGNIPLTLAKALEDANSAIYTMADENPEYTGMGTTVSAVLIIGNWAYMAQVGDSRVYLYRKSYGLKQLTEDHSLVAEQLRAGLITEEEAENHSLKNLITRAVGTDSTVEVDLFAFQIEQGDTLLICSDGLSGMVSDKEITKSFCSESNLRLMTRNLIEKALDGGGIDNATAITVYIKDAPPKTELQVGAQLISLPKKSWFRKIFG